MAECAWDGQDDRMKQTSFASAEFAGKKRQTRREKFLGDMETVVPWSRLEALIEPHYPKSGKVGRPPVGLSKMLRMYFLQQWYTLADEALEDALYDSQAMREFAGIDLSQQDVPDATTIIAAPSSTKNCKAERDPEMHQTKKGNEWHFGMKMHSGVDADSGLVHSVVCTAANESDIARAHELLHGQETTVGADSGYTGLHKRDEIKQAQREGKLRNDIQWNIAMKPGTVRGMPQGPLKALTQICERIKARVRARVEHPYHVIKNLFGYRKVSYRGLAKNAARAKVHAALANLYIARRRLGTAGVGASAA